MTINVSRSLAQSAHMHESAPSVRGLTPPHARPRPETVRGRRSVTDRCDRANGYTERVSLAGLPWGVMGPAKYTPRTKPRTSGRAEQVQRFQCRRRPFL